MSFIGVICDNRNENLIKQILTKQLRNENIMVFNKENIENLKNIKFETVLVFSNNGKVLSNTKAVKAIIGRSNYLVINADEVINLGLLENMNVNVITYGFNSKSTVTTSSVNEESLLLCVQRTILNINNKKIEPQEISVRKINTKMATNTIIGLATTLLLYNIDSIEI